MGSSNLLKQVIPLGKGLSLFSSTHFILKCLIFPLLHSRNLKPWIGTLVEPVQK